MRCVAFVAGQERHHDVGEPLLGTDERRRVGLAAVQLRQYLVGRIAAPRAVAIHLPPAPQVFGRRQIDPYVVGVADLGGVVAQQALDDGERAWLEVHGRPEGAVGVPVYGLENRVAAAQVGDVLPDDVHVVAVGVQRRDVVLLALLTVVAVVVVEGDVRHLLLAENPHESARDGRLARRRVPDDAQDDGAWHELPPQVVAGSGTQWCSLRSNELARVRTLAALVKTIYQLWAMNHSFSFMISAEFALRSCAVARSAR